MKNNNEAKCLLDFTERRMKKKKGISLLFTGESGDGKSYGGLRFLELWYKRWFKEDFPLINICNSLEEAILLTKDFKRIGEGLLIEELSIYAGRRDSLTTQNKLWNKFLDIIRIKQIVLVGNVPHISYVDKHVVMASQVWVNCEKVNFEEQIVDAHPLWLQTSPHKNEPYKHKFINKDGDEIDYCCFKLPSPRILKGYDKLKEESNVKIMEEIILKLWNNKIQQLKKFGQKILTPKEIQAYNLYLHAYSSKEGAKEMNLKHEKTYRDYLNSAKKKLKKPEYAFFSKEIYKIGEKEGNRVKRKIEKAIS